MLIVAQALDKAERTPKEELDEQKVVDEVKPLIEEGGRILTEANGSIRGLDPDGRIAANAKHKTAAREATPEEYRLADLLKELTGTVTTTIDNAKKKIADMPHVQKELNPLWGLLSGSYSSSLSNWLVLLTNIFCRTSVPDLSSCRFTSQRCSGACCSTGMYLNFPFATKHLG